jgi:hypothetical protein
MFACSVWERCEKGELAVHARGVIGVPGTESSATGTHKRPIRPGPLTFQENTNKQGENHYVSAVTVRVSLAKLLFFEFKNAYLIIK